MFIRSRKVDLSAPISKEEMNGLFINAYGVGLDWGFWEDWAMLNKRQKKELFDLAKKEIGNNV